MRRALPLALALVAGCATPPPIEEAPADILKPTPIELQDAQFEERGIAGLWNGGEGWLDVGASRDHGEQLFPKGAGKGVSDLPPTLMRSQFQAWGWENKKSATSFGLVNDAAKKRVVLALQTVGGREQSEVQAVIDRYRERFGPASAMYGDSARAQLHFWSPSPSSRLMICSVTNRSGGYTLTTAAGLAEVMDAIDASPSRAEEFVRRAQTALEGGKKPAPSPSGANPEGS